MATGMGQPGSGSERHYTTCDGKIIYFSAPGERYSSRTAGDADDHATANASVPGHTVGTDIGYSNALPAERRTNTFPISHALPNFYAFAVSSDADPGLAHRDARAAHTHIHSATPGHGHAR